MTDGQKARKLTSLHQASYHMCIHHERNGYAETLARESANHNRDGIDIRLCISNDRSDSPGKHDRKYGQNPGWHHRLETKAVRSKHEAVLSNGDQDGDCDDFGAVQQYVTDSLAYSPKVYYTLEYSTDVFGIIRPHNITYFRNLKIV